MKFVLFQNKNIKNGVSFAFFSFLNSGFNFILLLILARYLPSGEYGYLNLFNTLVNLVTPIISLSSLGFISVSYFRLSQKKFEEVVKSVILISIFTFIFISFLILVFGNFFSHILGLSKGFLFCAVFSCFLQVFTLINLEIWRINEKTISYGVYTVSLTVLNFIITLLWIIKYGGGWESRIYTLVFLSMSFSFFSLYLLRHNNIILLNNFPSGNIIKQTLNYGIPLIPHQLSFWIRQGLDRFVVNYFYNSSFVGMYSFAYNYANIIMILGTAFNATNSVYIYKNLSNSTEETRGLLLRQIKILTIVFVLATILVIVLAFTLGKICFPLYSDALIFVIPLCISAFVHCVYLLFVNFLFYYKKTKILMYITSSISILHLALSFILIKQSLFWAPYIYLLSNVLICLGVIYYSNKVCPVLRIKWW